MEDNSWGKFACIVGLSLDLIPPHPTPRKLSSHLFPDTYEQRGKGHKINIMIYSVMTLEWWPLYYFYPKLRDLLFASLLSLQPCLRSPSPLPVSKSSLHGAGHRPNLVIGWLSGALSSQAHFAQEGSQASLGPWPVHGLAAAPGEGTAVTKWGLGGAASEG